MTSVKAFRGRHQEPTLVRIELLCRRLDKDGSYLVIELKADEMRRDAIAQVLGYVGWLREHHRVEDVTGLVIGLGAHTQVPWVLKTVPDLVRKADWRDFPLPPELPEALGLARRGPFAGAR